MTNARIATLPGQRNRRRVLSLRVSFALLVPLVLIVDQALATAFVDPDSGHSYEVVELSETWDAARAAAEAMTTGASVCHLATITSQAENDFVVARLPSDTDMWIGGQQRDNLECEDGNDASFWGIWVTGEEWSYTNWDTGDGEPDDCEEQCLAYGEDDPILWENGSCDDEGDVAAFLVECEPTGVAAPVLNWVAMLFVLTVLAAIGVYRLGRVRLG